MEQNGGYDRCVHRNSGFRDALTLFESDKCAFLGSKPGLSRFLCELLRIRNHSSSTSKDLDGDHVYELLQAIIEHLFKIISKWIAAELRSCEKEKLLISVQDTKTLTNLMKYVSALFIDPYLEVPVGQNKVQKIPINYSLSPREKLLLLCETLTNVCSLIEEHNVIREISLQSLSLYLLNALLQVCFSPTSARSIELPKRKSCLKFLNILTTSWISRDRLIEDTITLQGVLSKNPPSWIVKKCGSILTKILLDTNGVKSIVLAMTSHFSEDKAENSWEKIIALSSILSTMPSGASSESYCELVCPQLIDLLVSCRKNPTHSKDITRVAVTTLHALHEKYPDDSKVFEKIICQPLTRFADGFEFNIECKVWDEFVDCVENLHQICVSLGVVPVSLLLLLLKPYAKILLHLHMNIPASNFIPSRIMDLFYSLLSKAERNESSSIIMDLLCRSDHSVMKTPINSLRFTLDNNGDVEVNMDQEFDPSSSLQRLDDEVRTLFDIVTKVEYLSGDVFLLLLKRLCDPSKNIPLPVDTNRILTLSERTAESMELNRERFITFGLLSSLLESCDPNTLLHDTCQVIEFIKSFLRELPAKLAQNAEESIEMLKMCTSVIGICMLSNIDASQRQCLKDTVPLLKRILNVVDVLDHENKELLSDLVTAILTYGAVNDLPMQDFSETMENYIKRLSTKTRTDDISSEIKPNESENSENNSDHVIGKATPDIDSDTSFDMKKSFSEALDDIHASSPALRGGSIRYLTNCISKQLPCATEKMEILAELFMESLNDNDSFVYLSAVQGLTVISCSSGSSLRDNELFERIVKEFLDCEKRESANWVFSKMKLGEIVTRVVQSMGDTAPSHAAKLLPAFLKLANHVDSTLRASALSSFAELAPLAPDILSSLQFEIRDCLCGMSVSDSDAMVRRSAAYAIRNIVAKLSDRILVVFPDTLRDIYRTLKKLYGSDGDNTVQLHAQLALEEIEQIMKAEIFKPPSLSKKITVLP